VGGQKLPVAVVNPLLLLVNAVALVVGDVRDQKARTAFESIP
jgi:hypothetical protein